MAIEIEGLTEDLLSLANTQDVNDNFIFSGSRVQIKPFAKDNFGNIVYLGDKKNKVQVSEERYIRFNRTGTDIFARVTREVLQVSLRVRVF